MKTILLLFTASVCYSFCFAQTDTTVALKDSVVSKSTLTVGAVYADNASYYGQKAIEKTPYLAIAASYRLKNGIYFSGLSYRLLNEKTGTVSAGGLGAGISGKLFKRFSADLNYSHSFFAAYSPLLQAGNPDNASLGLVYENWLNVSLTGDYAFGKTSDEFVTGGLSKSVNLFSIGKKDIVRINPSADAVVGTQHFYQTYLQQQKLRDSVLGIILNQLTGSPPQPGSKTTVTTAFNLLSYNLKLPLSYNRAHYLLEACYQLSVLSSQAQSGAGKTNSFFTASFYYQF